MKTIHIKNITGEPITVMRNIYHSLLEDDETFHFVSWSGVKWSGHKFTGRDILLRVDDKKVAAIEKYLTGYQHFETYDYPFPNRRGHLNRFGLGKKSIEAKYPDIFHQIYHIYSIMSLTIENPEERQEALFQLLHLPLNVYQLDFIAEAKLYSFLAYQKIKLLGEIRLDK